MGKTVALVGVVMLLCGCANYQIEATNNAVWRLDTRTGALEICGFEQGKPTCTAVPAPK
jgi:hypothetical protein